MTADELFEKYGKSGKVTTTVKTADDRGQKLTFSIVGNVNDLSDADELVAVARSAGANVTRKGGIADSKLKEASGEDAGATLASLLGVEIEEKPKKRSKRDGKPDTLPTAETNGHTSEVG